jgi:hypothetical protein
MTPINLVKGMLFGFGVVFFLLAVPVATNSPAYGFEFVLGVVLDTILTNSVLQVLLIILWIIVSWRAYDMFEEPRKFGQREAK